MTANDILEQFKILGYKKTMRSILKEVEVKSNLVQDLATLKKLQNY